MGSCGWLVFLTVGDGGSGVAEGVGIGNGVASIVASRDLLGVGVDLPLLRTSQAESETSKAIDTDALKIRAEMRLTENEPMCIARVL